MRATRPKTCERDLNFVDLAEMRVGHEQFSGAMPMLSLNRTDRQRGGDDAEQEYDWPLAGSEPSRNKENGEENQEQDALRAGRPIHISGQCGTSPNGFLRIRLKAGDHA
jgi:hypothetical protein